MLNPEQERLNAHGQKKANWKHWGPYLSERAWASVREDYSAGGTAWDYFPFEQSHLKAYRWGEDGIAGISDRNQYLCFALTMWNGKDALLKERLYGLTGPQGNHGEDAKEYWFYLDNTPTHSYMKFLYKYPQAAFPYQQLIEENRRRSFKDPEFELLDTGIFAHNQYFDVEVEYAKADCDDLLIRINAINRSAETVELVLLPTLWFRNTWSWGYPKGPMDDVVDKPVLRRIEAPERCVAVMADHAALGIYYLYAAGDPELIFTENETNAESMWGGKNSSPYVKDAFHRYLIQGDKGAVNPLQVGSKVAAVYRLKLEPHAGQTLQLRLAKHAFSTPFQHHSVTFDLRHSEADAFYAAIQPSELSSEEKQIQRQAFAGLLWSKQLYYMDVDQWLKGDPAYPAPSLERSKNRNAEWGHMVNFDVISMPDKWEYPWFATWDLAFHCLPLALVDPDFAKRQIELMTREWYIHPNGQLPAYEWDFSDVNPPVLAWAAYRVYKIEGKMRGKFDREFLQGVFNKLTMNFTWWVNRKDVFGNNIFQGGFLGMDNISVFDRSRPLPMGGRIDQSDGTAWMAYYCLIMLKISLQLSIQEPIYQDMATKFFEHFLRISYAMTHSGERGDFSLWHAEDGFFYDALHLPNDQMVSLRARSIVGLLPILAVETIDKELLDQMGIFKRRMHWFLNKRPDLSGHLACVLHEGLANRHLLAILNRERLARVLRYMLDESEFLSPYGIRSVSKIHAHQPFILNRDGAEYAIDYQPGESQSGLFGGNSNWRGPIWFPINFLLIEALQKFSHYYGDEFKVECPVGSGQFLNLREVAAELSKRLKRLFLRDQNGIRAIFDRDSVFQNDPHWKDLLLFHEYFHGESGRGLGACHQTGWTGLVAKLLQQGG